MSACRYDADGGRSSEGENRNRYERKKRFQNHCCQYRVGGRKRARKIVVIRMYYVSRFSGVIGLIALGIAVWYSIVLARADSFFRAGTPEKVQRAAEIEPRNTEYLALRALQIEYDGGDSTALTERIASLNPMSSAPRIRMGLAREMAGDGAGAEKWLLDAARVDHQFEPRWTLANFYFRAGRRNDFFKWIHLALERSYGDRTPAFDLCWRMSTDAREIFDHAIPESHPVIAAYLLYLSQTKRLEGAILAAKRLAAYRSADDLPLLYGLCDQLIEARDPSAVAIWELTQNAAPNGVFNGDFKTVPIEHGFDWRTIQTPGITHIDVGGGHRIAVNGQEPESCTLLRQALKTAVGKRYRLTWESRTSGIKAPSGLEWRVSPDRAVIVSSDDWSPGELKFSATQNFSWLDLAYQRPVGESRAEGYVEIRGVRMTELP